MMPPRKIIADVETIANNLVCKKQLTDKLRIINTLAHRLWSESMPRFSSTLLEHARYPCNQAAMTDADLVGRASLNGNPPFISIFLALNDGKIVKATFEAAGCGVTTAVCSATTEFLVGKSLEDCRALDVNIVCNELDGVPPDKMHCVHVVLKALANAIVSKDDKES